MVKHPVILRGYQAGAASSSSPSPAAPLIVKRTETEFVPGLLEGLRQQATVEDLGTVDPDPEGDGHLRLFQPVHRAFHLLVLECVCARPGFPRFDPQSIESAGLVVRRVPATTPIRQKLQLGRGLRVQVPVVAGEEAWQHRHDASVGWARLEHPLAEPEVERRPRVVTANGVVNQRLGRILRRLEPLAERVHPLFVAPPDVCAAAGRTLLYGVIPVTSNERAERSEAIDISDEDVQAIMPTFLRALGRDGRPAVGDSFPEAEELLRLTTTDPDHPAVQFLQELRLMHFAWRIFETAEGAAIEALLDRIPLRFPNGEPAKSMSEFLREAVARLVLRTETPGRITLPEEWPQPDAALAREIRVAVRISLQARLREDVPPATRFEDEKASYVVRGFVRVRCADGCPPVLHWSEPSAPFRIAPWWENGGPGATIRLPDLDPEKIKRLKPNVSFALPPKLANLMNSMSPDQMLKGNGSLAGPDLGWICSFSIPVITLCAFIVLNIFLSLLHLIFQWLFYIKICLPFPRR